MTIAFKPLSSILYITYKLLHFCNVADTETNYFHQTDVNHFFNTNNGKLENAANWVIEMLMSQNYKQYKPVILVIVLLFVATHWRHSYKHLFAFRKYLCRLKNFKNIGCHQVKCPKCENALYPEQCTEICLVAKLQQILSNVTAHLSAVKTVSADKFQTTTRS